MPDCAMLPNCPFFNGRLKGLAGLTELYKEQFCRVAFDRCARFMVMQVCGRDRVPADLYPTQYHRAGEVIARRT